MKNRNRTRNSMLYLIEILRREAGDDPVERELEEAEAVEDHCRAMGWRARPVEDEELIAT